MNLKLGFSPCPNDTFIFDALVNKKIDSGDLEFQAVLADVETLNEWALLGKLDITKLSFPAYFKSLNNYLLLSSGSALGNGVGPLLISKRSYDIQNLAFNIQHFSIAIPGENTTANMLLGFAFPEAVRKTSMVFSQIEDAVLMNKVDMGVIIHENRFTYQQKGLRKLLDLGEYWEQKLNSPIPLGGIAIKRSIDKTVAEKINALIRESIEFAFGNYPLITNYVKENSQEMSEEIMRKHIDLYVNDYSIDLGKEGKHAIEVLFSVYRLMNGNEKSFPSSSNLFLS